MFFRVMGLEGGQGEFVVEFGCHATAELLYEKLQPCSLLRSSYIVIECIKAKCKKKKHLAEVTAY
jgi:hypothetical protein